MTSYIRYRIRIVNFYLFSFLPMSNLEILAKTHWLSQTELDELKNYNDNVRMLLFRLIHPNGSDIYLFWYHPESNEVRWLVVAKIEAGKLLWETGPILPEDIELSTLDRSFQRIPRDELKAKIRYQ